MARFSKSKTLMRTIMEVVNTCNSDYDHSAGTNLLRFYYKPPNFAFLWKPRSKFAIEAPAYHVEAMPPERLALQSNLTVAAHLKSFKIVAETNAPLEVCFPQVR